MCVKNNKVRFNAGVVAAIQAHYERSIKSDNFDADREARWVVSAWAVVSFVLLPNDATEGAYCAARYITTGEVGSLVTQESIAIYKDLIMIDY